MVTTSRTGEGSKGVSLRFNRQPLESVSIAGGYACEKAYIVSYARLQIPRDGSRYFAVRLSMSF